MSWSNVFENTAGKIKSFYAATSPATRKMAGRAAGGAIIGATVAGPDRRGIGAAGGAAGALLGAGAFDNGLPPGASGAIRKGFSQAKSWGSSRFMGR